MSEHSKLSDFSHVSRDSKKWLFFVWSNVGLFRSIAPHHLRSSAAFPSSSDEDPQATQSSALAKPAADRRRPSFA